MTANARQERFIQTSDLCSDIRQALVRVNKAILLGREADPEDFVVLRGSTEALIELAENAPNV